MSCGTCERVRRLLPNRVAMAFRGLELKRIARKAEKRRAKAAATVSRGTPG